MLKGWIANAKEATNRIQPCYAARGIIELVRKLHGKWSSISTLFPGVAVDEAVTKEHFNHHRIRDRLSLSLPPRTCVGIISAMIAPAVTRSARLIASQARAIIRAELSELCGPGYGRPGASPTGVSSEGSCSVSTHNNQTRRCTICKVAYPLFGSVLTCRSRDA